MDQKTFEVFKIVFEALGDIILTLSSLASVIFAIILYRKGKIQEGVFWLLLAILYKLY